MLMDRIIGAFTFRKGVYDEVEQDASFTQTAWLIVAVVAFLNQLGTQVTVLRGDAAAAVVGDAGSYLITVILQTIGALIAFAVAAWVLAAVAKALFKATVTFEELVRTLGLAYVWNIIGLIGILAAISTTLVCLLSPVTLLAALLGLIAWFVAAKAAMDLDWVQTIVSVIIAFIVMIIVMAIVGAIVAALGFGAGVVGGLF